MRQVIDCGTNTRRHWTYTCTAGRKKINSRNSAPDDQEKSLQRWNTCIFMKKVLLCERINEKNEREQYLRSGRSARSRFKLR
jgi:hypothetical protein